MASPQFGVAIGLFDAVYGSVVHDNTLVGLASFGLGVGSQSADDIAESNQFLGNNLTSLAASVADVYLDTNSRHTLVAGKCRSYVDLGQGDRITCGMRVRP